MRFTDLSDFFYYTAISYPLVLGKSHSREIWEKGKYVGFRNLAGGRHNVGKFVRMLEKINKELKSVEGDISSMREGALYSVDELKYAYISVDEEHQFSLVVFS